MGMGRAETEMQMVMVMRVVVVVVVVMVMVMVVRVVMIVSMAAAADSTHGLFHFQFFDVEFGAASNLHLMTATGRAGVVTGWYGCRCATSQTANLAG